MPKEGVKSCSKLKEGIAKFTVGFQSWDSGNPYQQVCNCVCSGRMGAGCWTWLIVSKGCHQLGEGIPIYG